MTFRVSLFIFALALGSLSAQAQVQKIMTLAGNGAAGFSGDGANAAAAELWGPTDVVLDTNMNLYVVDYNNFRIRKVYGPNLITTVAGTGYAGNAGNGSIATSANIAPKGVAFDRRGNMFFSDPTNNVIRKVNKLGIISHYAGGGPTATSTHYGYTGDGGKADTARLNGPLGIAADDTGNLYIADSRNNVIRRIDTFGYITTIAGTGAAGFFGDGGLASFALLDSPYAVTVDHQGIIYINDYNNIVIRVIDNTKTINTYVGNAGTVGTTGYAGDTGPATDALLNDPRGICVDNAGNLYIADALNNVVRKVNKVTGIITTAAGNGTPGFGGDNGYVTGCNLFNPYAVAVDKYGSIYIADANNERIRKTYATTSVPKVVTTTGIDAYPNPCSSQVAVSGLNKADKVAVYDVAARQVSVWEATTDGTQTFDINHLTAGIYMLQVCDNEGVKKATVKLIKE